MDTNIDRRVKRAKERKGAVAAGAWCNLRCVLDVPYSYREGGSVFPPGDDSDERVERAKKELRTKMERVLKEIDII